MPTGKPEFLTEDEYDHRYKPVAGPDGSDFWQHAETLGHARDRVWSILEVDGDLYAVPGYHVVNVIGYNVTTYRWSHDNIEVKFDNPHDEHDSDCKDGDEPCNIV